MDAALIIKSIMGLIALLAILIFFLFLDPKKRKQKSKKAASIQSIEKREAEDDAPLPKTDLAALFAIIKNKQSDAEQLSSALKLIIKDYGKVHPKLGFRPHPDFDIYIDILFRICRHPNANKEMILEFDRELQNLNPEYKREINQAIAKGLSSRGS